MAKETPVKRHRYLEEQIIGILKEAEAGVPLADLVCEHGISTASFYAWRLRNGFITSAASRRDVLAG